MEATKDQLRRERVIKMLDRMVLSESVKQLAIDTLDEMQANEQKQRRDSAAHARSVRFARIKTRKEKTSRRCDSFTGAALTTPEPYSPNQESEYDRIKHIDRNENSPT